MKVGCLGCPGASTGGQAAPRPSTVPIPGGGGVLRYISYGDVQSPFLGLKFAI